MPASPPPDPKLLALQARMQSDQAAAAHRSQLEQQRAQNDVIREQVKLEAEIGLAKVKAELEAKMAVMDAHLKTTTDAQKMQRSYPPAARKCKNGNHYLEDPNRAGKYLLVVHHD